MDFKRILSFSLVTLGLFYSSIFATGCFFTGGVPQWSGNGFIRKELLEYKAIAVLPFKGDAKGEASDKFAQAFHEKFEPIALVGRKQVSEFFEEKDLYPDQLSEVTRREISEAFGVQAVIIGNVYYPSILRWLLQVEIIDVETGEVMGRSMVEIDYIGGGGSEGWVQNCSPKPQAKIDEESVYRQAP